MENRLQFRHHSPIFDTREEAVEYIKTQIRYAEDGLVKNDPSYGFSLFAEPTILRYKNEEDETNPHVVLVIGSVTNESGQYNENRFCIIDIDKTESEIAEFNEALEAAIKSLTLTVFDTNTVALTSEKSESGTTLSADVKLAPANIFDDIRRPNSIMATEDGLFLYVKMTYDEENDTIKFIVNGDVLDVKLSNSKLASGFYDKKDESLHLISNDGSEVVIDCEELIAEWGVEGTASMTPIVLTKEEVGYSDDEDHHHVEPWQDVLMADVRIKDEQKIVEDGNVRYIKDENSTNILNRTTDGRYLYVDGKASNIIYYDNGEKSTVKNALDKALKVKLSPDNDNIIENRADGFFSSVKLEYLSNENTLVFKATGQEDKRIELNSVELFKDIYYDATSETLVMTYVDNNGELKVIRIPLGDMMRDWEWGVFNDGHNVELYKARHQNGNDTLSADVKIYEHEDNLLEDKNHQLFVKGVAENIRYGESSNVKEAIEGISAATAGAMDGLDAEIARSTAEDEKFDTIIGSGFTTDTHETVTYKFEELLNQLNSEIERATNKETELENAVSTKAEQSDLEAEVTRATEKETELEALISEKANQSDLEAEVTRATAAESALSETINSEITRSTEKDVEHDAAIAEIKSTADAALKDIFNVDHSIDVDKTSPLEPVISVNISEEIEDERKNIIKLNNDGLYANVDLSYEKTANKLIFHTSGPDADKEILLDGMSDILNIYYDAENEEIVIQYIANGSENREFRISIKEMIEEWDASENTDGAIHLWKVRNTDNNNDILYAEAIINETHEDNALVNDHGSLYVGAENIVQKSTSFQCLSAETKAVEAVLGVEGECGEEITYPGDKYSILSGATTFPEADSILEDAINQLREDISHVDVDINGGETDTAIVSIAIVNDVKEVKADVKVKEDDTNVIEVVENEGLYLSNVWNCGEYAEDDSDDVNDDDLMNYNRRTV